MSPRTASIFASRAVIASRLALPGLLTGNTLRPLSASDNITHVPTPEGKGSDNRVGQTNHSLGRTPGMPTHTAPVEADAMFDLGVDRPLPDLRPLVGRTMRLPDEV